jgi:NAD-dependent deacetylase
VQGSQNVDNLHQKAGSKNLLQMHGALNKMRCQKSRKIFDSPLIINAKSICDCCKRPGNLRPHIVWFGEMPLFLDDIQKALLSSHLFISIGTSALVYPAANFYAWAKQGGAVTIELNLERTVATDRFDFSIQGKATELVPKIVEELIRGSFTPEIA